MKFLSVSLRFISSQKKRSISSCQYWAINSGGRKAHQNVHSTVIWTLKQKTMKDLNVMNYPAEAVVKAVKVFFLSKNIISSKQLLFFLRGEKQNPKPQIRQSGIFSQHVSVTAVTLQRLWLSHVSISAFIYSQWTFILTGYKRNIRK